MKFKFLIPIILSIFSNPGSERYQYIDVTVKAYCRCHRCTNGDGRDATNTIIRDSDYIVAVSPDLEKYFPISRDTKVFIPGYNRPGTMSMCSDRTRFDRVRQIEVLMTVYKDGKSPHRRALEWGVKHMRIAVGVK